MHHRTDICQTLPVGRCPCLPGTNSRKCRWRRPAHLLVTRLPGCQHTTQTLPPLPTFQTQPQSRDYLVDLRHSSHLDVRTSRTHHALNLSRVFCPAPSQTVHCCPPSLVVPAAGLASHRRCMETLNNSAPIITNRRVASSAARFSSFPQRLSVECCLYLLLVLLTVIVVITAVFDVWYCVGFCTDASIAWSISHSVQFGSFTFRIY